MTITVFTARTIVTMASTQPSAEAVAVENGRIVAVGSRAHVQAAIGDHPHVKDDIFADRVILPGLIDQHLHPILGATTLATEVIATEDWVLPDRTYPGANTHDEYVAALRSADRRTRPRAQATTTGYSHGAITNSGTANSVGKSSTR